MIILIFLVCFGTLRSAYAIFLKLSPQQIQYAIEYGKKSKGEGVAKFYQSWTVSLGRGKGSASLFTPFINIAHKARKCAVERREMSEFDIQQALGYDNTLAFSVTVYGDTFNFAIYHTAKLLQKNTYILPVFEFKPDIADASEFWPESPSEMARLVFKFPADDIDPNELATLIVIAPGGEETSFPFDLEKIK
ncbi:MAG: hypothetical protein MRJ65_01645 [Candidatus Brocadiaceae bacterium]|nr:hypothetical protein [Candidatus Brocadiaceae bacterium]